MLPWYSRQPFTASDPVTASRAATDSMYGVTRASKPWSGSVKRASHNQTTL
jgi:hypothetical protein